MTSTSIHKQNPNNSKQFQKVQKTLSPLSLSNSYHHLLKNLHSPSPSFIICLQFRYLNQQNTNKINDDVFNTLQLQMQIIEPILTIKLRLRLLALAISSSVALVLAVTLVIVLTLESLTGITSSPPLLLGSCTHTYYANKYANINQRVVIIYATSFISIVLQIIICVLVFPPLIARVRPGEDRMGAVYLLVCLHVLWILIGFSSFLTFHIDFNSMTFCSVTFVQTLITVVLAVAAADIFVSILQFCFSIWSTSSLQKELSKEETYRVLLNNTAVTQNDIALPVPSYIRDVQQKINNEKPTYNTKPEELIKAIKPQDQVQAQPQPQPQLQRTDSITEQKKLRQFASNHRTLNALPVEREASEAGFLPDSSYVEESLNSMAIQHINRPGSILAASRAHLNQKINRNTHGYLNYIRRLNHNNENNSQGELVAVIRGRHFREKE